MFGLQRYKEKKKYHHKKWKNIYFPPLYSDQRGQFAPTNGRVYPD